jgi:hypothetical protein
MLLEIFIKKININKKLNKIKVVFIFLKNKVLKVFLTFKLKEYKLSFVFKIKKYSIKLLILNKKILKEFLKKL